MNRPEITRLDRELSAYVDEMFNGMGRRERLSALSLYVTGLLLDGDRKSIEPMAGRLVGDTGFAKKKGAHSVGVSRQYSGTLGRVDNCQVAVSLHLASEHGSACAGMRLHLPEGRRPSREGRGSGGRRVPLRGPWGRTSE